ncbi:E3 ubiquitin-protein ligase lubel isoform X1 [Stomoxys calcitrans]|uniref:E3 ubiquitin-protein ligase lubel isoform X1 n=1 Tax=Stomoxys calcitrans TaxID=35570 RepID=UPI0027E29D77|nr:E3 ubiquitin-protein ligase lubel isoform X1 [Stomoxys calcitrans]
MALQANNRNLLMRNERTMPAWVTEQSGRIGPKPPPLPPGATENGHASPQKQPALPPKNSAPPEPDYEVIEFSNQQYSNAPLRPSSASSGSKTPDTKLKCTLCGSGNPWVMCEECSKQIFCASCDDMFHKHPKRKTHQRKALEQSIPPLPPKLVPGQPGPTPPVAPPRRNKRGFMTPLMQRKDQVNSSAGGHFGAVPPSPTPSMRNSSWHDRVGSLKRGLSMSILNRPLPETPKTPTTPSESSRCTTPKSAFDNIQRPPSVVLEKIKNKASATLDRMQLLQQRYRQQKEQMERERSGSINDQNLTAFDQWSSISPSPSHFRSGSMSSGINSSHLDLTDDSSFNLFHQRQMALQHHKAAAQRANQLGQRGMSSSVFNLNQPNRKPPPMNNGWMQNPMQQAQSMAQLNCSNCGPSPQNPWGAPQHMHMTHDPWSNQLSSQQQLNRSNLSLNVGPGYMMPHQHHNGMYPPPVFMTQRGVMGQMYPQGYMGGMPVMNPGLAGMPPSVSRAASRAGSRMGSPALSRKSVTLRRKQRSSYRDDEGTDDEDSDEDDRRSMVSNRSAMSRSRQRRMSSASQIQMDEDVADSSSQQRSRVRSQRRDSIAKSVHNDWAPGRKPSTNNRSVDSGFNSPRKPSRIYSDLDSEGSGTRALVQAKIEQKLKEESMKQQKQGKSKQKQEKPEKPKQTTSVQTAAAAASKTKAAKQQVEKVVEKEKTPTASESEEEEEEEMQQEQKQEEKKVPQQPEEESLEESEAEETKDQETQPQQNGHATPEHEAGATEDEDAVLLGPPPSTPDQEWECEFCTFVNEPNTKICIICCKTPSKPPKLVGKAVSPPPKQEKPADKGSESGTTKKETPSVKGTSKTTKKTQSSASTSLNVSSTSSSNVVVVDSSENSETPQSTTKTLKKKESLEDIWATLDENIQTTASEVTRKAETTTTQKSAPTKVSTGCGTSTKSPSVERPQEEPINKTQAREIGTSPPPPQTISTQTYEPLPLRKSETKEESPLPNGTRAPPNHDSLQPHNFPPTNKIQDLKSFETEVLQNIHNISHIPSPYQYQPLPQQHNHHHQQSYYAPQDRHQRYRSNNDLRMDDAMSLDYDSYNGMGGMGGMGRRHPSISELLLLQRTSSQMHSPLTGSSYDLSYRHNGMDNHKESDLYKYTTEELNAALKYCGPDMHPLVWLRDNWPKLIQTVQSLATKYGQERAENTIGTISQMEAREALRLHTGNIWQAVSECIEQRQRKYREISSRGNFSREDVVTALTTHQGNVEAALLDLGRTQLKPFLMRIWGSPGGVENESGAIMLPPASPQSPLNEPYAMDKAL